MKRTKGGAELDKNTLIVNFYAGAGAGKTTCAWLVAGELKKRNIVTEYVSEYAKELAWDGRRDLLDGSFKNQLEILNKQNSRIQRLVGKVDVIVTDSPILLGYMYAKERKGELLSIAKGHYDSNSNFNLFIKRGEHYEQEGRVHTLKESIEVDNNTLKFLKDNNIYHGIYTHDTLDKVVNNIQTTLHRLQQENIKQSEPITIEIEREANFMDTYSEYMKSIEELPDRIYKAISKKLNSIKKGEIWGDSFQILNEEFRIDAIDDGDILKLSLRGKHNIELNKYEFVELDGDMLDINTDMSLYESISNMVNQGKQINFENLENIVMKSAELWGAIAAINKDELTKSIMDDITELSDRAAQLIDPFWGKEKNKEIKISEKKSFDAGNRANLEFSKKLIISSTEVDKKHYNKETGRYDTVLDADGQPKKEIETRIKMPMNSPFQGYVLTTREPLQTSSKYKTDKETGERIDLGQNENMRFIPIYENAIYKITRTPYKLEADGTPSVNEKGQKILDFANQEIKRLSGFEIKHEMDRWKAEAKENKKKDNPEKGLNTIKEKEPIQYKNSDALVLTHERG